MPDVMTVAGPVRADQLGETLIHEHLLFDGDWRYRTPAEAAQRWIAESPLRMETLGWARKYGYEHLDNSHRLDPEEAIQEILEFKRAGGQTVVDVTPPALGRDPQALRAIARQTGLNVVMGCGYYVHDRHPAGLDELSVEDITSQLVAELTDGVGTSGIRAGIIGEIGTSFPMTAREEKVLRAAARAQAASGAPLSIHHDMWGRLAPAILEICLAEGADLQRTIVCHVDLDARCELEYFEAIASMGAFLGFDTCGHYDFYAYRRTPEPAVSGPRIFATDWDRAEKIAALAARGYLSQVVVAQDVCFKIQLKRYGGFGFDHVQTSVLPMLRTLGLTEPQTQQILIDNPARVLTGAALPTTDAAST